MKFEIHKNYDERGQIDNMLFERLDSDDGDYQYENVKTNVAELLQSLDKETGKITKSRPSVWNLEALMHNKQVHKYLVFGDHADAIGEAIAVLFKKNGGENDQN